MGTEPVEVLRSVDAVEAVLRDAVRREGVAGGA
jgi:hypothetical protein